MNTHTHTHSNSHNIHHDAHTKNECTHLPSRPYYGVLEKHTHVYMLSNKVMLTEACGDQDGGMRPFLCPIDVGSVTYELTGPRCIAFPKHKHTHENKW
jgi:hypothetical protein